MFWELESLRDVNVPNTEYRMPHIKCMKNPKNPHWKTNKKVKREWNICGRNKKSDKNQRKVKKKTQQTKKNKRNKE